MNIQLIKVLLVILNIRQRDGKYFKYVSPTITQQRNNQLYQVQELTIFLSPQMSFTNHFSSTETNFRRQSLPHPSNPSRLFRLSTQNPNPTPSPPPEAMQKHFRTTSSDKIRLKSQSIIVNRRKKHTPSLLHNPKPTPSTQLPPPNKSHLISKHINKKGPLDTKHIQQWLNTLLTQYCYSQKFDPTVRLSALKKFQIDRNSLLSKHLPSPSIDRLYKSLLVYSLGFNKLLKDLTKNPVVTKGIWRVYSLLIEYCAEGSFESLVAELERQKLFQLNQLQQQIDEKDKLLSNLNQTEKINKAKAYKELKHLREEHIQLANQKMIIEEDFRQADQAFNEEVNLRLKFEHKINEVNGVHRELGMKHLLLFQDFEGYKREYEKLYEEKEEMGRKMEELGVKLWKEEERRKEAEERERRGEEVIKGLTEDQEGRVAKVRNEEKGKRNEFLSRKDLEITHLSHQITTLNSTLHLREHGLSNRIHQLNILISQNQSLHATNEHQKTLISTLESKQSNYQQRTLHLTTQIQLQQASLAQVTATTTLLSDEITQLKSTISQLRLDLQESRETVEIMRSNGEKIDVNLREMKKANGKLERELAELRVKVVGLDELAADRQSLYGKIKSELLAETQKSKLAEFQHRELSTEYKLFKNSTEKLHESLRSTITSLHTANTALESQNTQLLSTLQTLELQNYELKINMEKSKSNLQDEKFERKQIDLQWKQSLLLVNDEKNLVTELTREVAEMKEERDRVGMEMRSLEVAGRERERGLREKVGRLEGRLGEVEGKERGRAQHVHPMVFEDVRAQLESSTEKFNTINYLYEELIRSLGPKQQQINRKIKRMKREHEYSFNQMKAEMEKKLLAKQKELEERGRECERLKMGEEEGRKVLAMKVEYIEIVERKLREGMVREKEMGREMEGVKERNQELNREVSEWRVKWEEGERRLKEERERWREERMERDEVAEMWRVKRGRQENQDIATQKEDQKEKIKEGKSVPSSNSNLPPNPSDPSSALTSNPNPSSSSLSPPQAPNPNTNPSTSKKPNDKSKFITTQSSFKNKYDSRDLHRTHKQRSNNKSQDEFGREREKRDYGRQQDERSREDAREEHGEKQITRKIKNAVVYYSKKQ